MSSLAGGLRLRLAARICERVCPRSQMRAAKRSPCLVVAAARTFPLTSGLVFQLVQQPPEVTDLLRRELLAFHEGLDQGAGRPLAQLVGKVPKSLPQELFHGSQ